MIPRARPPRPVARPPDPPLPPGACDAHVHVFGEAPAFPRDPGRAEEPADGTLADWLARLRARMAGLGLARVVLVHSVVHREDMGATLAALAALGDAARGVALVRPDVTEAELDRLHAAGIRGVRLDLLFPGALRAGDVSALAPRLAARGWHLQVFGRWAAHGDAIAGLTCGLPCDVVLDHLAYAGSGDLDGLLRLMAGGRVWTKLSSTYRQEAGPAIDRLAAEMPERLLWGSNWPHVRWDGPMPDETALVGAVARRLDAARAERIFRANPAALYGFPPAPPRR